jgi:hypothetical protein
MAAKETVLTVPVTEAGALRTFAAAATTSTIGYSSRAATAVRKAPTTIPAAAVVAVTTAAVVAAPVRRFIMAALLLKVAAGAAEAHPTQSTALPPCICGKGGKTRQVTAWSSLVGSKSVPQHLPNTVRTRLPIARASDSRFGYEFLYLAIMNLSLRQEKNPHRT